MPSRTFEQFLCALLAAESGLDPACFDWYVQNYEEPIVRTLRVSAPGRVVRDPATGVPLIHVVTVAEYLDGLGVLDRFDRGDRGCVRSMQFRAMNALGFIGYQFGEALLISTGHYRARRVRIDGRELDAYYSGSVAVSTWSGGRCEAVHRLPGTDTDIVATDVNRWDGSFTGKDGIASLADLKSVVGQERLIRRAMAYAHAVMVDGLSCSRLTLDEVLVRRGVTLSGTLAAAHLCGPFAVTAFLISGQDACDELGTSLSSYLGRFAGYEIPVSALAD
jgi:hypothetical protein